MPLKTKAPDQRTEGQRGGKFVSRSPVAPPVYRPQPTPRVLQTKAATDQGKRGSVVALAKTGIHQQTKRMPVAPSLHRPQPKLGTQPAKTSAVQRAIASRDLRTVQLADHNYGLRERVVKVETPPKGVPPGYVSIAEFNRTVNKWGTYSGLVAQPVDEDEIYVKIYNSRVFLWWKNPKKQIDDFVYTGTSVGDLKLCAQLQPCHESGYTWHHTGYPHDEQSGTMQLVPADEHNKIPHFGGAWLAYNEQTG